MLRVDSAGRQAGHPVGPQHQLHLGAAALEASEQGGAAGRVPELPAHLPRQKQHQPAHQGAAHPGRARPGRASWPSALPLSPAQSGFNNLGETTQVKYIVPNTKQ